MVAARDHGAKLSILGDMRDIVIFFLFIAAVFLGVGEWRGWYLGVPGSTPVIVYKMDHRAVTERRTVNRDDMAMAMAGQVRRGSVTVQVTYERPISIQTGAAPLPERVVFEQVYRTGQRVNIDQIFDEGPGVYRLRVTYVDVTGNFTFRFPSASQL